MFAQKRNPYAPGLTTGSTQLTESPIEIVRKNWERFDNTCSNVSTSQLSLDALIAELDNRNKFMGKLNFTNLDLNSAPANDVCRLFEVSNRTALDDVNYENTLREYVLREESDLILFKAVTGFGKSTKLPAILYSWRPQCLIIVVQPYEIIALEQATFMATTTDDIYHYSRESSSELPTNGIVYIECSTFLLYLKRHKFELPVNTILQIDESHTDRADYDTLFAIVSRGCLDLYLSYMTSATHDGVLLGETRKASRHIDDRPFVAQNKFGEALILEAREMGILQQKYLKGKVMIFMPDHSWCVYLKNLLKKSGYDCMIVSEETDKEEIKTVKNFLGVNRSAVKIVICTKVLETGITLNVDIVIDFSTDVQIKFFPEERMFKKIYTGITENEGMQRRGRCGRLRTGIYLFYQNLRVEVRTLDSYYLMVWFAFFNMIPPEEIMSPQMKAIGNLTDVQAAIVLKIGVHPLLLLECFDEFADVLGNLTKTMKKLVPGISFNRSHLMMDLENSSWFDVNLDNGLGGKRKVKIPFHPNSYDSEVITSILLDAAIRGNDYGDEDRLQRNTRLTNDTLKPLMLESEFDMGYGKLSEIRTRPKRSLTMGFNEPKRTNPIRNNSLALVNNHDEDEYGLENFNKHFSGLSNLSGGSRSSSDRSSTLLMKNDIQPKQMTVDEIQQMIRKCIQDSMLNYAPAMSPGPKTSTAKEDKANYLARMAEKRLDIKKLHANQSVMPLGCKSMSQTCSKDAKKFVKRKLLRGKVSEEELDVEELKQYCIYFCQFYNYLVTSVNTQQARQKFKRNNGGNSFMSSIIEFIYDTEGKLQREQSTIKLLQDLFVVWERFGLYVVPLVKGDDCWEDSSRVLFINEFLVSSMDNGVEELKISSNHSIKNNNNSGRHYY